MFWMTNSFSVMVASTEDTLIKTGGFDFEVSVRLYMASSGEQGCVERNVVTN